MPRHPAILDHAATLSDPTRWRILHLLERQELTVSELTSVLQLPQSTVSRHLKRLGDAGWVVARREGTHHFYAPADNGLGPGAERLWSVIREETAETATAGQDRQRLDGVLAERKTRSQEFFSSSAHEWDRMRDELFGRGFDRLALLGLLGEGLAVGDLGCGTGRISELLAPVVAEVVAVDDSSPMLAAARARLSAAGNVQLRQGRLERLPLDDASLDAATLVLALHHLPEPEAALAEARRTLRPGGRLLVVDMLPHDREEYRQQMGHVWLGFSRQQLDRLLEVAKLQPVTFRPLPPSPEARGPTLFAALARRPAAESGGAAGPATRGPRARARSLPPNQSITGENP